MISNQILQSTIDGLKSITRKELSVVEKEGKVIATTEENMIGRQIDAVENFISSPAESQLILGYQYVKIYDNGVPEYVIQVKGEDESGYQIGKIAAFQIQSLLVAYKERYDKDNFIKNLLLDNLLLVDIYSRAKKLHIENNVHRIVYLIETNIDKEMNVVEIVRSIFPAKTKDFVTAVEGAAREGNRGRNRPHCKDHRGNTECGNKQPCLYFQRYDCKRFEGCFPFL